MADYYLNGVRLGKGEVLRPGWPCTSVTESEHAGTHLNKGRRARGAVTASNLWLIRLFFHAFF